MTKRKELSPRVRFEVFKRDGFRCVYCGATAEARLEVDHVTPVAKGGTNVSTNLVTACRACNGGKSDVPLGEAAPVVAPLRPTRKITAHYHHVFPEDPPEPARTAEEQRRSKTFFADLLAKLAADRAGA